MHNDSHNDSGIVELLNEALVAEITAANQYLLHAKMCEEWGYQRLSSIYRTESTDETSHAEKLIGRILSLEELPDLQHLNKIRAGANILEQIEFNLESEQEAVERYQKGVKLCLEKDDYITGVLLEGFLVEEEKHLDWFKTQLSLIRDLGIARYQQSMMGEIDH